MRIERLLSKRDLQEFRKESPMPLYYRMYTHLKKRILDGTIAGSTQLPTEQQLAGAFSVSRITTRRAMDELAKEGLVERKRGRGTYVTHYYRAPPQHAPLDGMLERLAGMSRDTQIKVLDIAELAPPERVRSQMGLAATERACRLTRVRYKEEEPFAWYLSWTVGDVRGFDKKHLQEPGVSRLEILHKHGIQVRQIDQWLSATAADIEVAACLGLAEGAPLLTLERHSWDSEGRVVDILYGHYHPARFQYRMSLAFSEYDKRRNH